MSLFSVMRSRVPHSVLARGFSQGCVDLSSPPGLARRCLVMDILPACALPKYECGSSGVYCLNSPRKVELYPQSDVILPLFDLKTSYSEGKFYKDIKRRMLYLEDKALVHLMDYVCTHSGRTMSANPGVDTVNQCFSEIECHDVIVAKTMMNLNSWSAMKGHDDINEASMGSSVDVDEFEQMLDKDTLFPVGSLWSSDVYLSSAIPNGVVYMTSSAEFLGVMPVRKELLCSAPGEGEESLGMAVLGEHALFKLEFVIGA